MYPLSAGAAFVDRSGAVLAADAAFVARLGLDGDPAESLRAKAERDPALRTLLAGAGPAIVRVTAADGDEVELERAPAPSGALLVLRERDAQEWGEHALRSRWLGRLVAGIAHDVRNPLNAMSLQIALLSDKLSSAAAANAVAGHLEAMREQIGRVKEVLRRAQDALEPSAQLGYTDLGALAADAAGLLVQEARRRRVTLAIDARPGLARTACDVARVGRLVLGACASALAQTPDGGRIAVGVEARGAEVALVVEHAEGDPEPGVGYDSEVLAAGAAALGGRLERASAGGVERLLLVMPGNDRA